MRPHRHLRLVHPFPTDVNMSLRSPSGTAVVLHTAGSRILPPREIVFGRDIDPEESFVASLSSCHMLTFLAIACKQKFVLDSYEDEAVGHMEKNADGKLAITRVELRPKITWSGDRRPSAEELEKMHHSAHENCFIANSVKTDVTVAKP